MTIEARLFGGRIIHHQPATGFRSGIEPVLLAASVPAKAGEHVLEAGTGSGAALLCLHARVPGVRSVGVEIDAAMAGLARCNAAANSFQDLEVKLGAIESVDLARDFHHAIANPPYHPANGTASPVAARNIAKRAIDGLIAAWIGYLARHLRHRGSLTLIVPIAAVPSCLSAMATAQCSCTIIYPLWPMADRAAKLAMIRGIRNSRSPMRMAPGLVLHNADGSFTGTAQALLRNAAALEL